jgi:hypothetical protein
MAGKPHNRKDKNPITQEQFEAVCELIEKETGNILAKCKQVGISSRDFYAFKKNSEENRKRYARAKDDQSDLMFEELIEIADEIIPSAEHGLDSAAVADKRVRIDARKWYLSKLKPERFGEKLDLTSGGDKLQSPPTEIVYRVVK